ncbi:MAG: 50S ribosomal protein L11 methyltransferase [Desulfobulbus sp.]|nr:50S ribosomal protein L11 methyltransferase [Desulfobulbus sp.]
MENVRVGSLQIHLQIGCGAMAPSEGGKFFCRHLPFVARERIVDIGTGSGLIAIVAALHGAKSHATDLSDTILEVARTNAKK